MRPVRELLVVAAAIAIFIVGIAMFQDRLLYFPAKAVHHYPWLPVRWLLRDRYDTVETLRHATLPLVIVVAEQDAVDATTADRPR